MSRRIGRWTYDNTSTRYGVAGWHLDDSPLVIDFMPGSRTHQNCPDCAGEYQLYNWPPGLPFDGTAPPVFDHQPVARYLRDAMEIVEKAWLEVVFGVLAGVA
jgi:hypothetical protein